MGYAQLAGLPPVTGLYATLIPLIVYFLLGPSRILIVSPDSAVCPLVAAAIVPLAGTDPGHRVADRGGRRHGRGQPDRRTERCGRAWPAAGRRHGPGARSAVERSG